MNIEKILAEILYLIIITSVPILLRYITLWLQSIKFKADNEVLNSYLEKVKDVVNQVVISVNQTYTDELKKQNIFGKEEHEKAFILTKDTVLSLLDDSIIKVLNNNFIDANAYIDTLIETAVKQNKKGECE